MTNVVERNEGMTDPTLSSSSCHSETALSG
jgi:hypothetical protein